MDVKKIVFSVPFVISTIALSACQPSKTTAGVFSDQSEGGGACPTQQLVKSRFLVNYEDGRFEIVQAENKDVFIKKFLEPKLQEIKHVEYDQLIRLNDSQLQASSANDVSDFADPGDWGPAKVNAPAVWAQGVNGQGVLVGIVDAAVDYTHPQLKPRLAPNLAEINGQDGIDDDHNGYIDDKYGWDVYGNQPQPTISQPASGDEPNEHGSHVAGIIAADHSTGDVLGMATQAQIVPANFMDQTGGGTLGDAIIAMKYVASRGVKVINASWGGSGCSDSLRQEITDIGNKGILFVVASGNDGYDYDKLGPASYEYPAVFNQPNQITVAATDDIDQLTNFSNRSYSLVHIGAPGLGIRSTIPYMFSNTGSGDLSGTSMATPFVSGAAALLWSAKPNATVAQIRAAILGSADVHGYKVSTQGRLNVQRALDAIRAAVP